MMERHSVAGDRMEITQLQHFVSVAKFGNFGRAATELHVTQSALSKSVKRLEAFLNDQKHLLSHVSRVLGVTQQARRPPHHARRVRGVQLLQRGPGDA